MRAGLRIEYARSVLGINNIERDSATFSSNTHSCLTAQHNQRETCK